jgi:hypothetical protein
VISSNRATGPALLTAALSLLVSSTAAAAGDVRSVFSIGKSENTNEVHYGVRVDSSCRATGSDPVYAYWRMNERGGAVEPLLDIEQRAYGIASGQSVVARPNGSAVRIRLRAMPDRLIEITTVQDGTRCVARARTTIAAADAWLEHIFVQIAWPFGVAEIRVSGARVSDAARVTEAIQK